MNITPELVIIFLIALVIGYLIGRLHSSLNKIIADFNNAKAWMTAYEKAIANAGNVASTTVAIPAQPAAPAANVAVTTTATTGS